MDTPSDESGASPEDNTHEHPVTAALDDVLQRVVGDESGEMADHIPELADRDPDQLAVALVSTRGHSYGAGDVGTLFTSQSISKPLVYALALTDHDVDEVHRHVGFEPSGEPFNSISLDEEGRPDNPMINAGAIVTSSLVRASDAEERFSRILRMMSAFAGRDLEMDEEVYSSERDTGDRNHALAHLARASGVLGCGVDEAVDTYFRQCSVLVDARDLAVMGATLAAGGVNPVTGDRVVTQVCARHTLSLMVSCGMYDGAGEWMMRVGMPAKSGVSGGILAVKPGQFGIGVFSPRLDVKGNSARGVAILDELSNGYGLHLLRRPATPERPTSEGEVDEQSQVVRPRGEIDFVGAEVVVRDLLSRASEVTPVDPADESPSITLDLEAVTGISVVARGLLGRAMERMEQVGCEVHVEDPEGLLDPED